MLSTKNLGHGIAIAIIKGGKMNDKVIFINQDTTMGEKQLIIKDKGHLLPFPDPHNRQVIYVAGASGSGKSTYSSQYIYNYLELFPNNKVFVFSRLKIDPVLESMGAIEVPINEE